jgi:hypothetical protein
MGLYVVLKGVIGIWEDIWGLLWGSSVGGFCFARFKDFIAKIKFKLPNNHIVLAYFF